MPSENLESFIWYFTSGLVNLHDRVAWLPPSGTRSKHGPKVSSRSLLPLVGQSCACNLIFPCILLRRAPRMRKVRFGGPAAPTLFFCEAKNGYTEYQNIHTEHLNLYTIDQVTGDKAFRALPFG